MAERFAAEGARSWSTTWSRAGPGVGGAMSLRADVSSKAQVDAMFDAVMERFGTVDILVNNAGNIHAARHFLEADEQWWDQMLGVNLKGAFLCSLRAAHIMARKGSGVIINMSSGGATKAHRGNVAYDASKGGIEAMTRAMALDLAPYGIRVNAIVPGLIRTYDLDEPTRSSADKVVPWAGWAIRRTRRPDRFLGDGGRAVHHRSMPRRWTAESWCSKRSTPVDTFPLSDSRRAKIRDL